jgi:hypothetical protein
MAAVMALVFVYALAVGHAIWFIRRHKGSPQAKFALLLLSLFTAGLALERVGRDLR